MTQDRTENDEQICQSVTNTLKSFIEHDDTLNSAKREMF